MNGELPTESELAARREANAKATAEAIAMAEAQKARDAANGIVAPDVAAVNEAASLIKDKLFGENFGDPATLRPREGVSEQQ